MSMSMDDDFYVICRRADIFRTMHHKESNSTNTWRGSKRNVRTYAGVIAITLYRDSWRNSVELHKNKLALNISSAKNNVT